MELNNLMEQEGRCPYCKISLWNTGVKSKVWKNKIYEFRGKLYECYRHGYFMWKGKKGNVFIAPPDFSPPNFRSEAKNIKVKPPDTPFKEPEIAVVWVSCDSCGEKWRMFLTPEAKDATWCPVCKILLNVENGVRE